MTDKQIEDEVIRILRSNNTDLVDWEISPEMSFEDLGLDSLNRIDVLAEAESVFEMSVPDAEVGNILKVRDLIAFIASVRVG
ncbi:acyl carrier protein [Actinospica robiniae]|uniref:acyl carrier protein n=1 Tax=Actinospica robiniae TaxID=304901 RepID=UPI0004232A22|nr:acyl carrier protein [Actinospica robiniae]